MKKLSFLPTGANDGEFGGGVKKHKMKLIALLALFAVIVVAQVASTIVSVGNKIVNFIPVPLSTVTVAGTNVAADATNTAIFAVNMATTRRSPAGVQFDLNYPPAIVNSITTSTGPAAVAAGKVAQCAAPPSTTGVLRCLVIGSNANLIANGDLVDVTVTLSADAQFTLSGVVAVTADANSLNAMAGAPNTVTAFVGVTALTCTPSTFDANLPIGTFNVEPNEKNLCTVTMNTPAPAGGSTQPITVNGSAVLAPAAVTIPAGQTVGTFTVTGR